MEFLKALSAGWVGSLIGLIGLVIAFLLYRASRVGPRPVYQCQALRLIAREKQALPEDVTVLFRDKKVQRLTKTYVIIWNSGKTTVNGEDIVADDPLRFEFSEDSEVLSARTLRVTRKSNNFTVNINPRCPNQVTCSFAYLDAGDGAAIELLHTDGKRYPKVQGSIRGIPKGILDWGRIYFPPEDSTFGAKALKRALILGIFFGMIIIALGLLLPIFVPNPLMLNRESATWLLIALGLMNIATWSLIVLVPIYIVWRPTRRFPKALSIEDIE